MNRSVLSESARTFELPWATTKIVHNFDGHFGTISVLLEHIPGFYLLDNSRPHCKDWTSWNTDPREDEVLEPHPLLVATEAFQPAATSDQRLGLLAKALQRSSVDSVLMANELVHSLESVSVT